MKIYFYSILIILFIACQGSEASKITTNEINSDSITMAVDNSSIKIDSLLENDYEEVAVNADPVKIEKKYGKQWDFCDCIYKTDSVNKAIENSEHLSDADITILFDRFEAIDLRCKALITGSHRTPEERKIHQRKVRKCKQSLGIQ